LIKTITIKHISDLPLNIDVYDNKIGGKSPLLIFVHGFKGFKNWGGFPYMLEKLSHSGITAAALNFTHNGVNSSSPMEFTNLDLFAKNTFSRELSELQLIIDYFSNNAEKFNIDNRRIAVIGHSRGGGISVLQAARDDRIKCLIALAPVSSFNRYGEKTKELWRKQGFLEIENTRTKQMMKLNLTLLEDLEKNSAALNIIAAMKKIKIPTLLIHGREDVSVKYEESETLFNSSDKTITELLLIENTGHTFGIVHPFSGTTGAFEKVIEKIKGFLKTNL
jgi:uncharacterized protein